jgi:exosortase A
MSETFPLSRAWLALAVGLLLLGGVFYRETAAAVEVWKDSTAYNHCFLILPIAVWLAWQRRAMLVGVPVRPTLRALPAGLLLGGVWFAADRLGIMEGRELAAMGFVQLLFFSVLGWPLYRTLAAPLLFLFFLVPFGGFLVPLLQTFTTHFVVRGLDLLGIPNFNTGNTIEIPEGAFYVATACAGLRFLIAAVAFSVFYSCVIYRTVRRRIAFIAISLFVPVIANGMRALGIVWLGHVLGSASAAAADHVLYGYIFFSMVLLTLILLGLLFREDHLELVPGGFAVAAQVRSPALGFCLVSSSAVVVLAALWPLTAFGMDRAAAAAHLVVPAAFPGCVSRPDGAKLPAVSSAGGVIRRFACAGDAVTLTVAVFPPHSNPRIVFDAERAFSGEDTREAETRTLRIPGATPGKWQLVITNEPPAVTASALWIDGEPATGGLRWRLRQALNSLFGGRYCPLVVAVRSAGFPPEAQHRLSAFLASGGASAPFVGSFQTATLRR